MANLRFSKDWTITDLLNYKISVSSQSPDEFYGIPLPTVAGLSALDPHLVSGTLDTPGLSDETYRLLQHLDLASMANAGQESAVGDFAREILRVLGYESRGLLLRSRHAIPLLICAGSNRSAQTNVSLIQGSSTVVLLVVREEKSTIDICDPEPQVIADAIATFQLNNLTRARSGRPELDSMTIPCITMTGTRPIFYLVPVTRDLSESMAAARFPRCPTVVKKCVVASNSGRLSEGMETPDFRQLALRHYIAFRILAEAHWSTFMIPVEMGA